MRSLVKGYSSRWMVVVLTIVTTLLLWSPFWLRIESLPGWGFDFSSGMETVFANFDGTNYLIIARSWYDGEYIRNNFSNPLPLEYYPAHLPLYPAIVSVFDLVMPGTWAMLVATLLGSVLATLAFFKLMKSVGIKNMGWFGVVFLLLPARWVVVKAVGSPEPWFIAFILMSLVYFREKKYWLAGLFGALAQLTKSPGILLFVGYGLYFLIEMWTRRRVEMRKMLDAYPLLLMPLAALGLFYFYYLQTGDFWAYFNSGDNFHLFLPPFSIFAPKGQVWTGEFWLEEIIFIWLIYGLGVMKLWKKNLKELAVFSGVFFVSTLLVAHRDIARYILPIFPLVLIGWEEEIRKKEFKVILLLLVIPILLYSWNFILNNTMAIDNWGQYL